MNTQTKTTRQPSYPLLPGVLLIAVAFACAYLACEVKYSLSHLPEEGWRNSGYSEAPTGWGTLIHPPADSYQEWRKPTP